MLNAMTPTNFHAEEKIQPVRLPVTLRKNGYTYNQVVRGQRACIYEVMVSEGFQFFEVFRIRIRAQTMISGKQLPAREIFPHNEDFGYRAFAFREYSEAFDKYLNREKCRR